MGRISKYEQAQDDLTYYIRMFFDAGVIFMQGGKDMFTITVEIKRVGELYFGYFMCYDFNTNIKILNMILNGHESSQGRLRR